MRWNKSSRWDKRITAAGKLSGGAKMRERKPKRLDVLLFLFLAGFLCWPVVASAQFHPKDTEWPSYAADLAGTRYRPLDQINAANFSDLKSPGASRRTTSVTGRSTSSKVRRSW